MAPGSCILANPENCDYLAEAMENEKKPTIIRLTKEFTFEAAHALEGYDGLCREIHGHSYRLFVTVKGTPCADESNPKFGMVMDFGELKRIVNEQILSRLDHAFVMRRTAESTRVSPPASKPTCRPMSSSTPCVCTKRRLRSPSGWPRITDRIR